MANNASSVNRLGVSTQSDTTAYMERLVTEVGNPDLRENAICVLSKRNDLFPQLALLLWKSFGIIAILLQEIISIYPALSPETLTTAQSTRVCNALALFQCVASHPDLKIPFLNANIPQYLYPFLKTTSTLQQFEYLRIASLGVIGGLVKARTKEVINFLLSTEIVPLCLQNMEIGKELSKSLGTFILQKIMLDDDGLAYVCATDERFFALHRVLGMVMESYVRQPSPRLLKIIIPCYARLSQNPGAGVAIRTSLPEVFRNPAFINALREDPTTWNWAQQLYDNVANNPVRVPGINDIGGSTSLG